MLGKNTQKMSRSLNAGKQGSAWCWHRNVWSARRLTQNVVNVAQQNLHWLIAEFFRTINNFKFSSVIMKQVCSGGNFVFLISAHAQHSFYYVKLISRKRIQGLCVHILHAIRSPNIVQRQGGIKSKLWWPFKTSTGSNGKIGVYTSLLRRYKTLANALKSKHSLP